jgi:hypothetical protein
MRPRPSGLGAFTDAWRAGSSLQAAKEYFLGSTHCDQAFAAIA